MGLRKCIRWWLTGLIVLVTHSIPATAQPFSLSHENLSRVGSLVINRNQPAGSCFYIDSRGWVVTSYFNLLNYQNATIQFNHGGLYQVDGIIAVSPPYDIAILQLKEPSKSEPFPLATLELDRNYEPEIGQKLAIWKGPNATPFVVPPIRYLTCNCDACKRAHPRLQSDVLAVTMRHLYGQDFLLGLTKVSRIPCGYASDAKWTWLDQPRHHSWNGGPVLNEQGKVVGMVSNGLLQSATTNSVIHIQHVLDLIPKGAVKVKSINAFNKVHDEELLSSLSQLAEVTPDPKWIDFSSLMHRGTPLAARFDRLLKSQASASEQLAKFEESKESLLESESKLQEEGAKLAMEIDQIPCEETYTVERQKRVKKTRRVPDGGSGKDRKYRDETYYEDETIRETHHRHSRNQMTVIGPKMERIGQLLAELRSLEIQSTYLSNLAIPAHHQAQVGLENEAFCLADPLGLKSDSERAEFETWLTQLIDKKGATASIYFARSMCRCQSGNLKGAQEDLSHPSVRSLDSYQPLAAALDARIGGKLGNNKSATLKLVNAAEKAGALDPRVWVLLARMDLDSNLMAGAMKRLQQASKLAPYEPEIFLGMAWVSLCQPTPRLKDATQSALSAVRLTAGRDENAWAVLAAAHATDQQHDKAKNEIALALRLAKAPQSTAACTEIQALIDKNKPILRTWK